MIARTRTTVPWLPVCLALLAAFVGIAFSGAHIAVSLKANMSLVQGFKAYARGEALCSLASGLVEQFERGSQTRVFRAFVGLGVLECMPERIVALTTSRAYLEGDALLQFHLGRYLERQGQIGQAIDLYRKSGIASSLAAQAYREGVKCGKNGDSECQEREWLRAVQLSPEPYYYDALVGFYLGTGRLRDAADVLDDAAETIDDPVFVHLALGRSLDLQGEYAAAILELRKAAGLAPDDVDVQYRLGLALRHAGHFREAKEVLIRVVEHRPESFWALVVLSETCLNLAQWGEALQWYDRALALRIDVASVYLGRGEALVRLGRMQEARAALMGTLRLEPSNPRARQLLEQVDDLD